MSLKANIFDIQRASIYDGPGIRTTVFFKGCPLECLWCHNPESHSATKQLFHYPEKCTQCGKCQTVCENNVHTFTNGRHVIHFDSCEFCGKCVAECSFGALKIMGEEMRIEEVMSVIEADTDFYSHSGGGVTFSGGEPLIHIRFLLELLKKCKAIGVHTCIETSGSVSSENFRQVLPLVDLLLFDYKVTGSAAHKKYTGVSNELILENLDIAYQAGIPIILRCPIIPGINDTEAHFRGISELDVRYPDLAGIELLPYHAIGNSKRNSIGVAMTLTELKTTPPETGAGWIAQLHQQGCTKAKIGWD